MTGFLVVATLAGCMSQPMSPETTEVAEILVTPESLESESGRLAKFTAEAIDGEGRTVPNTRIEWDSADPSVAVVDTDGTVWSFKAGSVDVTAHPGKGRGASTAPGQAKKTATVTVQETQESRPHRVDDLRVESIQNSTVTLSFTEVDDGTGSPADYLVRFQIAPIDWGIAASVTQGTCAGRLTGTAIGSARSCTVSSLVAGNSYEFQLVAIRGSSTDLVHGDLSNVVSATLTTSVTSTEGLITRHTFTEPLEDGWTDRGDGNYSHGFENGDGYGQANYSPNLCVGCGPIQVRRGFDHQADEVTVSMRYQMSENMDFNTGSKVKKIFFLETPTTTPIYFAVGGAYQLGFFTQRTAGGAARYQGGPSLVPGRIYDVELYVKLNSVDASGMSRPDGIVTVWLDGQRIVHQTDVRFRGEDNPQKDTGHYFAAGEAISGIRWNPTWPNGGEPPAEHMWERIYDISVVNGTGG